MFEGFIERQFRLIEYAKWLKKNHLTLDSDKTNKRRESGLEDLTSEEIYFINREVER